MPQTPGLEASSQSNGMLNDGDFGRTGPWVWLLPINYYAYFGGNLTCGLFYSQKRGDEPR